MELKVNSATCHFCRKIMEKSLVQRGFDRQNNALLCADFVICTISCLPINLKNIFNITQKTRAVVSMHNSPFRQRFIFFFRLLGYLT